MAQLLISVHSMHINISCTWSSNISHAASCQIELYAFLEAINTLSHQYIDEERCYLIMPFKVA